MKRISIIVGLVTLASAGYSQQTQVVVANHPTRPVVQIKYYTPQLYFDQGVNIYRRQEGTSEWTKLNTSPLTKGTMPPQQEIDRDQELRAYLNMLDSASREQIQGLILFTVLVKSFTSESLSRYLGLLYEDATAQRGTAYEYRVSRITGSSDEQAGISEGIVAGAHLLIDPPADINVSEGKKDEYKAHFAWRPETDRYFGVNVYRSVQGIPGEQLITKHPVILSKVSDQQGNKGYPEVMFEDDSLQAGRTYEYQLTGVDFFGRESKRSPSFRIEIKDNTPPPSPERLSHEIDHQQKQVALAWRRVTAPDLAGYFVYRSRKREGPYQRVNSALVPPDRLLYTDQAPLARGYYYYVAAVDRADNEANSDPVYAEVKDVIPPVAPVNVQVRADTGKVMLTWTANAEPDLLGYQVYRTVNTNNRDRFVLLNASAITETTFKDQLSRNVKNKFLYRIVAVDSAHNKSEMSAAAITRLPDVTPPASPFIKQVSAGKSKLIVEWMPITEKDVVSISVLRASANETTTLTTLTARNVRYEDDKVEAGITYEYFLTAADSSGNESGRSNGYSGMIIQTKTMETIQEIKITYDSLKKWVTVSWPALQDVDGFVVYRKVNNDEFRPVTGVIPSNKFQDSSIIKGRSYTYRIKAFDEAGLRAESKDYFIEINE